MASTLGADAAAALVAEMRQAPGRFAPSGAKMERERVEVMPGGKKNNGFIREAVIAYLSCLFFVFFVFFVFFGVDFGGVFCLNDIVLSL